MKRVSFHYFNSWLEYQLSMVRCRQQFYSLVETYPFLVTLPIRQEGQTTMSNIMSETSEATTLYIGQNMWWVWTTLQIGDMWRSFQNLMQYISCFTLWFPKPPCEVHILEDYAFFFENLMLSSAITSRFLSPHFGISFKIPRKNS